MQNLQASIYYNGEKVYITPGTVALEKGLEVTLEVEYPAEEAAHLLLKFKNTGNENTYQIQKAKTLDVEYKTGAAPVYHGLSGDYCGAVSFLPREFAVTEDYHEEPTGGRSSDRTGFPYFDLTWEQKAVVFGIGWTGQWSKDVFVTEDGVNVQVGLCDSDFYLKPGEEVRGASVLVVTGADTIRTRRRFRSILKEEYSPKKRLGEEMYVPVSIQCFDRYYGGGGSGKDSSWNTEAGQIRTVDAALKVGGIDTLWLDAAWFTGCFPCGVGNFSYHDGFPNSLGPVADYAHKNGMKFVLWFEPERVHRDTEVYPQAEKILIDPINDENRLYNLADDAAREWLKNKLISMIRENGVDVYRQDFNIDPLRFWRHNDEEGRIGITEMKYIAGLYDLWDSIIAEYPHILIDNCASGGRRLDLETAKRSITLWKSDTGCFTESMDEDPEKSMRVTAWSQNQTLALSEYIPYHACAVWEIDPYTVRSTATKGVACNFHIFDPEFDFAGATRIVEEVHELAPYWEGEFTPLTKITTEEDGFAAWELSFADKGAVYVFRREFCEEDTFMVKFTSVEEMQKYKLVFIDEKLERRDGEYTGAQLREGLSVKLDDKRSSMIIKYEKA